jgi:Cytochrome c7 and related cytochrome c
MPQIFRPYADTIARMLLVSIAVIPFAGVGLAYWVAASDYVTDQSIIADQPVPFSHAHHVGGLGIDCRYCHAGVETSPVAGVPPTHTCMTCHSQLYTQTAMLAPVRASLADDQPIPWNKVNKLPDYVYFDHSIHIAKGVGCSTCHGDVSRMPLMLQAQPLTMGWCLDCHRDPTPYLRPPTAVFDPDWKAPADQYAQARMLLAHDHIDLAHLTDCSVCHR